MVGQAAECERIAVDVLRGVGGDAEWWIFNGAPAVGGLAVLPGAGVGHLRVPLTTAEYASIPIEVVVTDAGDSGPQRPRTP